MPSRTFQIEIQSKGFSAKVAINGCTVWDAWDRRGHVLSRLVHPFLVEGKNHVEAHLEHLPARPDDEEPAFEIKLYCMPAGEQPFDLWLFLGYQWTAAESVLSPSGLTRVLDHSFHVPERYGRWAFEEARPMLDRDRTVIESLVLQTHAAVAARDVKGLRAFLSARLTELALGYEMPRDDLEAELLQELGDVYSEDDFRVEHCSLSDLELEPALGGRLVHVRTRAGGPAIRASGGGKVFSLPIAVACVGERWTIVR